jgi:hypothetical protein
MLALRRRGRSQELDVIQSCRGSPFEERRCICCPLSALEASPAGRKALVLTGLPVMTVTARLRISAGAAQSQIGTTGAKPRSGAGWVELKALLELGQRVVPLAAAQV